MPEVGWRSHSSSAGWTSLSQCDWKMASETTKSDRSNNDPAYWRRNAGAVVGLLGGGDDDHCVGEAGERGVQVGGEHGNPRPGLGCSFCRLDHAGGGSRAGGHQRSRSPLAMAGVVESPATWTFRPWRISLMAVRAGPGRCGPLRQQIPDRDG
jgi:hypothetical protein